LVGTWLAEWPNRVHQEIRVDEVSNDGLVDGVFCGVRLSDGSVFFFDFSVADPSFDGSVLRLQRGTKHSYWFSAVPDGGVRFVYRRIGRKSHTTVMHSASDKESLCIDRVRSPSVEGLGAAAGPDGAAPLTGVWTGTHDRENGLVAELHSVLSSEGDLSGILCHTRRDGSMVFFQFGPGADIEAIASEGGFTIERVPFRAKMTHRFDASDGSSVRYRERVRRKPWRVDMLLQPGASETGCLRRIVLVP